MYHMTRLFLFQCGPWQYSWLIKKHCMRWCYVVLTYLVPTRSRCVEFKPHPLSTTWILWNLKFTRTAIDVAPASIAFKTWKFKWYKHNLNDISLPQQEQIFDLYLWHASQRLIKLQSIQPKTRTVPVHSCPSYIFLRLSLIQPRICNMSNLKQIRTTSCQFTISNYHIKLNDDSVGKMTAFTIFNFQEKTNTAYVSLCATPPYFRKWITKKI